MNSGIYISNS